MKNDVHVDTEGHDSASPKVYLETTVVSYVTGRLSRNAIVAGRQRATRQHWQPLLREFDCYVSVLVVSEAGGGDPLTAAKRLTAIAGLPVLQLDQAAESLARSLIEKGPIPKAKGEDALHIALAARDGMDFLVTWNFSHIHNARMEQAIRRVVLDFGYQCPVICSPEELMGE